MKKRLILSLFCVLLITNLFAAADVTVKLETSDGSSAVYFNDSSDVTVSSITSDGNAFYMGKMGINTSVGASTLTVNGIIESISGGIKLPDASVIDGAEDLGKWTEGAGNVIYYNTANVGIGTTNPLQKLEVTGNILGLNVTGANGLNTTYGVSAGTGVFSGAVSAQSLLTTNNISGLNVTGTNGLNTTYGVSAGTGVFTSTVTVSVLDTGQGANELYDMDQNVLTTSSPSFSEVITSSISAKDDNGLWLLDNANNGIFVQDGGNIGISTIEPAARLDIIQNGTAPALRISGGTNPYIRVTNGIVVNKMQVNNSDNTGVIGTEGGHTLNIITGNSAKITV
ncbi:MAG: hypothetical protein ABH857_00010, partial [Elusimicrobiota bacterium]